MANHKSAIKRARQNEKRRIRNRAGRSTLRTALKSFEATVEENPGASAEQLKATMSALAKAAKKGLIPTQRASRKIARLSKRVSALG